MNPPGWVWFILVLIALLVLLYLLGYQVRIR